MTTSAQIKAGEAWVMLNAKMGNLKQVLDQAKATVGGFAGSVNQFGDKIGGKFGNAIVNGLAAFVGVNAIDGALRKIAERMKDNLASGESMSFAEVGTAIGESIAEGLKSIPVAGALGDILATQFDSWFGGGMAQEAMLKNVEQQRARIQAIFGAIRSRQDAMDSSGLDPAAAKRAEFDKFAGEQINALVREGYKLDEARQQVDGLRASFEQMMGLDAEEQINAMLDGFDQLAGQLGEDSESVRQFERALRGVEAALIAAGRAADIPQVTAALRDQFDWSKAQKEANDKASKIKAILDEIKSRNEEFGLTESQLLARKLEQAGASAEEIAKAKVVLDELQKKIDDAAERTRPDSTVASTISTSLGAVGSFSPGFFDPVGASGGGGALVESTKETARNTRKLVSLMQKSGLVYGA